MTRPLRVGIAGLGTVGASVIRILDRQNEAVAQRGGRPVRGRGRLGPRQDQGPRLRSLQLHVVRRSGGAGPLGRGGLRRRAGGRRGRRSAGDVRDGPVARQARGHGQQGAAGQARPGARAACRGEGRVARLRGLRRRRHPDHQDPARGAAGQPRSRASTASSTAPATTSSPAWSWRA